MSYFIFNLSFCIYSSFILQEIVFKEATISVETVHYRIYITSRIGSVSRVDDILALHFDDLNIYKGTVDSAVCAILKTFDTSKSSDTYLTFE